MSLNLIQQVSRSAALGTALLVARLFCACAVDSETPGVGVFSAPAAGDAAPPLVGIAAPVAQPSSSGSGAIGAQATAPSSRPSGADAAVSGMQAADSGLDSDKNAPAPTGQDAGVEKPDATVGDAGPADAAVPDARAPDPTSKFVGNITTNGQVRSDFAGMWNQITPENEGKWGSVESVRNQMNWAGLDRAHTYARQNGVLFKQHTLVWGSQQPGWLSGLSAADQAKEVEEWIRLFCERYPDVDLIDVVNEPPPHTKPVYMNALGGAGASGYDWIVQAFKWARKYCPKAILILNDYNTIEYANDNSHFIDIAKAVKKAGAPIDALGAQAHAAYNLPTTTVQQMLDKMANDTGLPVYITEYDIDLADDSKQRQVMESQFTMFWRNKNVKGITLWGYISGATWVPNSGLMSSSGKHRPALDWLLTFLKSERSKP